MESDLNNIPNSIVKEVTLESMCAEIFSKPPNPPRSNIIQIHETCVDEVPENEQGTFAYEFLQNMLFSGIAIAFPKYVDNESNEKLNLSKITMNDFEHIKKYMQSFGYNLCIDIIPISEEDAELNKINPKQAVINLLKNKCKDMDVDVESDLGDSNSSSHSTKIKCKCGWSADKNKPPHFSDYYIHFIRNDNLGISLHFILY